MKLPDAGFLSRWARPLLTALGASVVFGPAGLVPGLLLGRLLRHSRASALVLTAFALGAASQEPREDQTQLTMELGGNAGKYQRVCGGTQSLYYGGGLASLDTEVWPGHRVVGEARMDGGITQDEEAQGGATGLTGSVTLMGGYEHRWGALLPGVAVVGSQRPEDLSVLPAGRVRIGPEDLFYWQLHLFPDLRAQRDYAFRSSFVLVVPVQRSALELGAGVTGAGGDYPMPYGLVSWEHPVSGLGFRLQGGSVVERREWWFVEGAITWRVSLDPLLGAR